MMSPRSSGWSLKPRSGELLLADVVADVPDATSHRMKHKEEHITMEVVSDNETVASLHRLRLEERDECVPWVSPHWRQGGATYFVTFRLADSIPRSVVLRWQETRKAWLEKNGLANETDPAEFQRTYQAIHPKERTRFEREMAGELLMELDQCHGECLLAQPETADIVRDSLLKFDGERYRCGDFCIMPNHVHWLCLPITPWQLDKTLQSIKSFTAKSINRVLRRTGPVWQRESFDRIVRDREELNRTRLYIAANPRKARIRVPPTPLYRADWLDELPQARW